MDEEPSHNKLLLTVREAADYLGIGVKACRTLFSIPGFPVIHASPRRTYIQLPALQEWLRDTKLGHLRTLPKPPYKGELVCEKEKDRSTGR